MLAKIKSSAVLGLEGVPIDVEVDVSPGMAGMVTIVGLPDTTVRESKERVRAALLNSGANYTNKRLTINLAPADLRKEGPAYDLPIAVGLLVATGQMNADIEDTMFVGELSLDGAVRHISGVLPMAAAAKRHGVRRIFCPLEDAPEAALIPEVAVYGLNHLSELLDHFNGGPQLRPTPPTITETTISPLDYAADFAFIKGQAHVKRALEVASAGSHNVLLSGPPGAGKTLLARSVPSIMAPMTLEEALDVTAIFSVANALPSETPLVRQRPFRAPHHTISHAGLIGGGRWPRPGEISLSHRGVLFLDELLEFDRMALETLRQPLEDKKISIGRAAGSLTFPAAFMLIAATNPCPCGFLGDPTHDCSCTPAAISKYQKRLSGPLLDRFDIHITVPRVEYENLADDRLAEPSAAIRARVEAARRIQQGRFEHLPQMTCNGDMGVEQIRLYCKINSTGQQLMKAAMRQMNLSARAYHRTLKLARTIADLAGAKEIEPPHLAEALQYRRRE